MVVIVGLFYFYENVEDIDDEFINKLINDNNDNNDNGIKRRMFTCIGCPTGSMKEPENELSDNYNYNNNNHILDNKLYFGLILCIIIKK